MKFYHSGIELDVPESVYCPREDSLLLARVLENLKGKKILEMGCGSGFLAILLANGNEVTAADIDEEAVRVTERNAIKNNVKVKTIKSDLFSVVNERFDVIVFNPPYLPDDNNNITYSGGSSGRDAIERFVKDARDFLNQNGKIYMVISSLTGEKEVLDLFHCNGFETNILARDKIPWEELMVIETI